VTGQRSAVGLFHFNIRYVAGDVDFYRRYTKEVVEPFLSLLERNPKFRTSIHLCGADIEYLSRYAPEVLDRMRALINIEQLELISALYSNAIWVAFPLRDLIRSVELNRRVLDQNRLLASNIFFSQEAFWGMGVRQLNKFFDRAVCKDDYLKPASSLAEIEQAYRLGNLSVIVGANHLLNHICALDENGKYRATLKMNKQRLDLVRQSKLLDLSHRDMGVHWYHLGSAHHLVTAGFPNRRETFLSDGDWIALVEEQLDQIGSRSSFSFIRELEYDLSSLPELPQVIEGAWNYRGGSGVRRWMGWHTSDWERDAMVLCTAWQSRSALQQYEHMDHKSCKSDPPPPELLDKLWKQQLLVEGSDSLGWNPRRIEVESSLREAELLLTEIANLTLKRNWERPFLKTVLDIVMQVESLGSIAGIGSDTPVAIGNADVEGWCEITPGVYLLRVELRATGIRSGVQIKRSQDTAIYCPSAEEQSAVTLQSQKRSESIFLPLTNGLLSLGENDFLITINLYGKVAAELVAGFTCVEFTVEGPGGKRPYSLVFLRIHGHLESAIKFANLINEV